MKSKELKDLVSEAEYLDSLVKQLSCIGTNWRVVEYFRDELIYVRQKIDELAESIAK